MMLMATIMTIASYILDTAIYCRESFLRSLISSQMNFEAVTTDRLVLLQPLHVDFRPFLAHTVWSSNNSAHAIFNGCETC